MRFFIAVDLSDEVRKALSKVQKELRPVTDTVRWVAPDSIHITLKFLGEVHEKRIAEIDEALVGLSWKPFAVKVRGVGFFPGTRSPRVFWAGIEAPTMKDLAEQIDTRIDRLGFEKERRSFRSHITLARVRDTRIESSNGAGADKYQEQEFGSLLVDRIFLFQNTLKSAGALYDRMKEYRL